MSVPAQAILRCVNRHARLKKLRALPNAPAVIIQNEEDMLSEALDELMALAIEHGLRPSEAEVNASIEEIHRQEKRVQEIIRGVVEGEEDLTVMLAASRLVDAGYLDPSPESVREAIAAAKAEEEQDRRELGE